MASFQEETNKSELEKLLEKLAVADFLHDFKRGEGFKEMINNQDFKDNFEPGISNTEEPTIPNDTVDENLFADINRIEITAFNSIFDIDNFYETYIKVNNDITEITTKVNGKKYQIQKVRARDENNNNYINANTFIDGLQIPNNSAFVVDAVALSIRKIIKDKTGWNKDPNFNIYYLMSSEIMNDPASKTRLDSKEFEGSIFVPCCPSSLNDNTKNYKYDGTNINIETPNTSFLTKYNFQLDKLTPDENTQKLKTNLDVYNGDKKEAGDNIDNNNSIKFLYDKIQEFYKNLPDKTAVFNMNANIQRKRSGDWLQVLFCLAVKNRKFVKFDDKTPIDNQNISNVYFVTHDRIAMAFALLMGVDVLFTHGATKIVYSFTNTEIQEGGPNKKKQKIENSLPLPIPRPTQNLSSFPPVPPYKKVGEKRTRELTGGFKSEFQNPFYFLHELSSSFNESVLDSVEESLDYDIYIWYYYFLKNITDTLEHIEINNNGILKNVGLFINILLFSDKLTDNGSFNTIIGTIFDNRIIKDYSLIYGMNTQLIYYGYGKYKPEDYDYTTSINNHAIYNKIFNEIINVTNNIYNEKMKINDLIKLSEELVSKLKLKVEVESVFSFRSPITNNLSDTNKLNQLIPVKGGRSRKIKRRKTKKTNQKNKKRTTRKHNK